MAYHMQEVLLEGDDAPDFFMTGEDKDWIDETTEYMESNFKITGAHAERDFIGGPPILDQITEFVYTCKKTVVEFCGRSEWSNYTCRMVIHRMFQESQENSKHRLIVVLRDKSAEQKVPKFLQTHSKLKYWEPDFYWKLWNSIKGSSLRERTLRDKKPKDAEFPMSNEVYPMPDQVICSLPSSEPTNASRPDVIKEGRFIPEDHLEQPGSEPGEMTPRPTTLDEEGNEIRDKFYFEESPGTIHGIQNLESRFQDGEGRGKSGFPDGDGRGKTGFPDGEGRGKSEVPDGEGIGKSEVPDGEGIGKSEVPDGKDRSRGNSGFPDGEGKRKSEDQSQDLNSKDQKENNVTRKTGKQVPNVDANKDMEKRSGSEDECSDTESMQQSVKVPSVDNNQSKDIKKNKDVSVAQIGENLLKELKEYETKHQEIMEADKSMTQMKPDQFKEHQQSIGKLGEDGTTLLGKILKKCAEMCGMQASSANQYDIASVRDYLLQGGHISTRFDQRLRMIKITTDHQSLMSTTVQQMPNAIIVGQCIKDLETLICKTFK